MELRVKKTLKSIRVHQSRSSSVWLHQLKQAVQFSQYYISEQGLLNEITEEAQGRQTWQSRGLVKNGERLKREKPFTLFHLMSGDVLVGLWPSPDPIMTHDCPEIYGPLQTQWHSAHYQYQQPSPLHTLTLIRCTYMQTIRHIYSSTDGKRSMYWTENNLVYMSVKGRDKSPKICLIEYTT